MYVLYLYNVRTVYVNITFIIKICSISLLYVCTLHRWVATEWLPDIGLPQYTESFMHSMVDARMLDTLSKKELEKFLSVTRKFHQASIVHGKLTIIIIIKSFNFCWKNIFHPFPRKFFYINF